MQLSVGRIRRVALAHAAIAFFYSVIITAQSVTVVASSAECEHDHHKRSMRGCGGTSCLQTIADVSVYAGQSVQFRYRLGSDSSVGKPGWDLDDVTVQGCAASAPNIAVAHPAGPAPRHRRASSNQTLTIGNTGALDLNWAVVEEPGNGGTCSSPSDVAWLSVAPTSGTTAGAASTPLTVTLDSTGLAGGTYNASLCVTSDDPGAGPGNGTALVVVPVSLEVDAISIFRDGFED